MSLDRVQDAHTRIMLIFDSGGDFPLPEEKREIISTYIQTILTRVFETQDEKKQRKWQRFQEIKAERA